MASGHVRGARSGWLTGPILSGIVLALAVVILGCSSSTPATSGTPATTQAGSSTTTSGGGASTTTNSGSPALGMSQIPGGTPVSGASFLDGPVAVGGLAGDQGSFPVIWRMAPGSGWSAEDIDTSPRTAFAAFELNDARLMGDRRLVVGINVQDAQAAGLEDSFAAVEKKGGGWDLVDLGTRVPAGTSIEVRGLGATGDPLDINTFFVAVGGTVSGVPAKGGYLFNDLTGATPISMISLNGTDWNPPVALPLPDGVSSAEATSVTFCGPNTPAPGVLATGLGYASDPTLGNRLVGIVWRSTDQGTTWTIIADSPFDEPGRNMWAGFVASDGTAIVIGGQADIPGTSSAGATTQRESMFWNLALDGSQNVVADGASLQPSRSSGVKALAARPGGGFLASSEIYDTSAGDTGPTGAVRGDPAAQLLLTPDGANWTNIDSSVPGIDQGLIVDGIIESGGAVVFLGRDASGGGAAWTVEGSSIK